MRSFWTRIQPWASTLGQILYRAGDWFLRQLREGLVRNLAFWSGVFLATGTVWATIWFAGVVSPPTAEAIKDRLRETRDRFLPPEVTAHWNEMIERNRALYHEFALYHGWRKPEGTEVEPISAPSDDSERDGEAHAHEDPE